MDVAIHETHIYSRKMHSICFTLAHGVSSLCMKAGRRNSGSELSSPASKHAVPPIASLEANARNHGPVAGVDRSSSGEVEQAKKSLLSVQKLDACVGTEGRFLLSGKAGRQYDVQGRRCAINLIERAVSSSPLGTPECP